MNPTDANRAASANPNGAGSGPDDPRVLQAVEEYLAALEAGRAPDRDEFLARHAAIAARLGEYLDGLDLIHRAGSAVGPVADGNAPADDLGGAEPLGDFLLVRELGRGGMGVVYEAMQRSLNRKVALKVLPFAAALDARQLQRFKNEALAAASLHHPNIVPVFGVGCERAVHYYAMQLIDGQTLAAMIADLRKDGGRPAQPTTPHVPEAPVPLAETATRVASTERPLRDRAYFRRVAELGIQAAEALDHAHGLGIVHRDIKPANLMLDERGNLWVTDFGLAHIQSDARLTLTGDLVGTLRYMSPEQALANRGVVDHRTDVYSLGATLFELLTLAPAYRGSDRQELLRQIAFEEPVPPRRLNRAVPAELETIVLKAMEKNLADRYATAQELADDLRRFQDDQPIRARRPSLGQRLRRWGRRHRAAATAAAVCLLVTFAVAVGSVGWVMRDHEARRDEAWRRAGDALQRADDLVPQEKWSEGLRAVEQSEGFLAGFAEEPALRLRARQLRLDLEMALRLQEARLSMTGSKDSHFDWAACDAAYVSAFRVYGLDVDDLSPPAAAEQVQARPIHRQLVAALDDWAYVRRSLKAEGWRHRLAVARAADPDQWRNRLRDVLEGKGRNPLEELAVAARTQDWPAENLVLLGRLAYKTVSAKRVAFILARAQQRHPDDFWINHALGPLLLAEPLRRLEEAIRFLSIAVALQPQSPNTHNTLGIALHDKGLLDEAIAEYRKAIDIDPKNAAAHDNLGFALQDKQDLEGAIAEYRKAIACNPKSAHAHNNLGFALHDKQDLEGAIAEYRKAIACDPKYVYAHNNLGTALHAKHDLEGAIAEWRLAIACDPKHAGAHNNLGAALRAKHDLEGAIGEFRKAIDSDPKFAPAHYNLGIALAAKQHLAEAITEWRLTVACDPKHAGAHNNLGSALRAKQDLKGAIAEYRKAIGIDPKNAPAHNNLGNALAAKQDLEGAIEEYRKAIDSNPRYAKAHTRLGSALRDKGQFADALTWFRRGHELGPKDPRSFAKSAHLVKECERLVELDRKLPAILSGKEQPTDASQRTEYAEVCHLKRLYATAARLYQEAILAKPNLVAAPNNGIRYNAACAAALAGCGRGEDAGKLTDAKRAGLRKQALDWLRADLDAWRRLLDKGPDKARGAVTAKMQDWQKDSDLAGIRDKAALDKLPAEEQKAFTQVWADAAALLKKAQTPAKEETR